LRGHAGALRGGAWDHWSLLEMLRAILYLSADGRYGNLRTEKPNDLAGADRVERKVKPIFEYQHLFQLLALA